MGSASSRACAVLDARRIRRQAAPKVSDDAILSKLASARDCGRFWHSPIHLAVRAGSRREFRVNRTSSFGPVFHSSGMIAGHSVDLGGVDLRSLMYRLHAYVRGDQGESLKVRRKRARALWAFARHGPPGLRVLRGKVKRCPIILKLIF